jgi:putative FmdB family regulatory protein
MPIYDYQCSACGHKAEVMRKVSAASVEVCPVCHQQTFSKQVSAPSFQLNGTGWYATDFKNSGAKPTASAKTTDALTESKPAATCNPGCACH